MIARVVRTAGGKVLDHEAIDVNVGLMEKEIQTRDGLYGRHLHSFNPTAGRRDYWLLTWPVELAPERAAEELLFFTLTALDDDGDIGVPAQCLRLPKVRTILDQTVVFSKMLAADGTYVDADVRSIGERFVEA